MSELPLSNNEAQFGVQQNVRRLHEILPRLTYKEDWSFSVRGHAGWHASLQIQLDVADSNHPRMSGMTVRMLVSHQFQVPYFVMSDEQIERWLLDCILLVERHEACEHFRLDGGAPYYPEHGEGADPYRLRRTTLGEPVQ